MPEKLPSQREFLTNLVHVLCKTHDDDSSSTANAATRATERYPSPVADTWGSLRRRKLVLTLHVIFPGMLLPALDLLDRQLVRRLTVSAATAAAADQIHDQEDEPSSSSSDAETKDGGASETARHAVYTVRSLASTLPRRGAGAGAPAAAVTRMYLVHLAAWSCSCADFAVDSYAVNGIQGHAEAAAAAGEEDAGDRMARFGGLSTPALDAHGAESIPCCKHLLACFLADEWEEMFTAHVEERHCSKEELAGIVTGI